LRCLAPIDDLSDPAPSFALAEAAPSFELPEAAQSLKSAEVGDLSHDFRSSMQKQPENAISSRRL
jgi:hypothetical protein